MKIITKSNLKAILFILVWSIFIFSCSLTLRSFHIPTKPPLWDNLAYQLEALQILKDWLNGGLKVTIPEILNSRMESANTAKDLIEFGLMSNKKIMKDILKYTDEEIADIKKDNSESPVSSEEPE